MTSEHSRNAHLPGQASQQSFLPLDRSVVLRDQEPLPSGFVASGAPPPTDHHEAPRSGQWRQQQQPLQQLAQPSPHPQIPLHGQHVSATQQPPSAVSTVGHSIYGASGGHTSQHGISPHADHTRPAPMQMPLPSFYGGGTGQSFPASLPTAQAPPSMAVSMAGAGRQPVPASDPRQQASRMAANPLLHPMHRAQPAYLSFEVPTHPDMAQIKLTRGTSCVLCQQRKVRCDKRKPCANCVKAGIECRVVPPQPPRRRKKRLHERDLVDRLRKYESLLVANGVPFDSVEGDLRKIRRHGPGYGNDVDDLEDDFQDLHTSPESTTDPPDYRRKKSSALRDEDSPEDEDEDYDGSVMQKAFDELYGGQEGFPFFVAGRIQPVTHLHPPPVQIFQLWQVYLNNVNPILRITHVPTVQAMMINATADLAAVPKNLEALMFTIYMMAVSTLDEEECPRLFGVPRKELYTRYHSATQQALVNAGFMRTNDMLLLTAFVLYLFAIRQVIDPRQIFCLGAVAVRIAQRMGLHRDGAALGLSPYEVEQRRRLWWTLVGFDRRLGEIAGSPITALSIDGNCKLPLNINDNDIHVDGTDAPKPHAGPTEMVFALVWLELAMAIPNDRGRDSVVVARHDKSIAAPPPSERVIRLAHQADSPTWTIDGFCAHIEGTYLDHCDPKVPFHFFTLNVTRQALCKMRIISFLMRKIRPSGPTSNFNQAERDTLFAYSVQMLEHDNAIQSTPALRSYKWYTFFHFPFPAYLFLLNDLRRRTTGPTVEHAWKVIAINHELRGFAETPRSPMHLSFGPHFLKAFSAHQRAMENAGQPVERPRWIANLAVMVERRSKAIGPLPPPTGGGLVPPPATSINDSTSPSSAGRTSTGAQAAASQQPAAPQGQAGPSFQVATPPEDGTAAGATAGATSGTTPSSDNDFDWAFLLQEYESGSLADFHLQPFPLGQVFPDSWPHS